MSKDLTKNKSWCPIPWVTYSINSLGHYRLCVQANAYKARNDRWRRNENMGKFTRGTLWESNDPDKEDNQPLNCLTTSLNDVRNNDFLKEVREHMLRGERHPVCKRCNEEDDNDVLSRRMAHRELHEEGGFTVDDAFKYTNEDGTIPDTTKVPLLGADIRLGNLCNQKCRMCYPGESSTWYQEWYDTFQYRHIIYEGVRSKKLPKFTGPGNTKLTVGLDENKKAAITQYQVLDNEDTATANVLIDETTDPYVWTDSKALFEKLSEHSPKIQHIHMSGGEPLMITQHYEFLQGYVDNNQAKDIILNYNTNLSNIPQRAFELWKHFEKVELRTSIDGAGQLNEYIRHPSNWDIVLRNLRLLTEAKKKGEINLSIETITTVQMYNVFYLMDLVIELTRHKDIELDDMILHMLHDPRYFNITSLPSEIKDTVADKLSRIGDKTGYWKKQSQGVINHMYKTDTTDALDQFFIETRIMDKYRKQHVEDAIPELYGMIQQYDPLHNAEDKLLKAAEKLDNAYIVNVYEKDVKDLNELQYTHIQILGHKNWQNKNVIEDHKSSLWKSLARIFEGK
jgi:organic radical activating enzyme